jgi:hypothetical protein
MLDGQVVVNIIVGVIVGLIFYRVDQHNDVSRMVPAPPDSDSAKHVTCLQAPLMFVLQRSESVARFTARENLAALLDSSLL